MTSSRSRTELRLSVELSGAERVDKALAAALENAGRPIGRKAARTLIEGGSVVLDGRRIRRSSDAIPAGRHELLVTTSATELGAEVAQRVGLVELDDDALLALEPAFVVIDKPSRLPSDRTRDPLRDSAIAAAERLLERHGHPGEALRAVHRLDLETSGVLVLARTKAGAAMLSEAFRERRASKKYMALCEHAVEPGGVWAGSGADPAALPDEGWPIDEERVVEARIGPIAGGRDRGLRGVSIDGQSARTRVRRLDGRDGWSLLLAWPESGRTHQIRVHLAWLGFPIAGDERYGASRGSAPRVMLHAQSLEIGGGHWSAPLPKDFRAACRERGVVSDR